MTIPKNTKRAAEVIANAKNIVCYSLSNNFQPIFMDHDCPVWREGKLVYLPPKQFLINELSGRHCKLSQYAGNFTLHVHSNLWYEFSN